MPTAANTNALSICVKSAWNGTVSNSTSFFNPATITSASSMLTSRTLSGTIARSNEFDDGPAEGDNLTVNKGMDGTLERSGTGNEVRISSGIGCSFSAMAFSNVFARHSNPSSPKSLACWASLSFSPSEISLDMAALGFPRTTAMGLSRMYSFISPCQYDASSSFPSASSKSGKISTSECNAAISSCGDVAEPPFSALGSPARGP
mmetsp:Transcript_11379/g.24269  ORF Transcript_11379/g.24269 Transcript_11379/m.24269 type:complete len:205 (-) Transcript_11379:171-785(-)